MTEEQTSKEAEVKKELTFNEKLLHLIVELHAPKNQRNKFGNYNFRSAEDILEAVKPIAFKYGLLPNLTDEIVFIGERYYVKATASITDGENHAKSKAFARESEAKKGMDESQISGTASSYARKYAMNGLYLIDDNKDADTNEYKQQNDSNKTKKITKTQATALNNKISNLAGLVKEKRNENITGQEMTEKLTKACFSKKMSIESLNIEQFNKANEQADKWEAMYKKM